MKNPFVAMDLAAALMQMTAANLMYTSPMAGKRTRTHTHTRIPGAKGQAGDKLIRMATEKRLGLRHARGLMP